MRAEILIRQRISKLMIVLVALFGAIAVRIVSLTVIQGDELTARGVRQWTQQGNVAAQRGSIMDRNSAALALRLGTERLYQYLTAFGLGRRTGIDLPGESAGILINSRYVKSVDLARIGFGQSVAVTPIQLITAFSAVVNGGRLMKPYIVAAVQDEKGEIVQRTAAQQVMLYTAPQDAVTPEIMADVSDVRGMSVVEASRALRARGFELRLEGSGIAAKQIPAAGTFAPQGASVTVTFAMP